MGTDLLDLYDRASSWATEKVAGATEKLDARTPCDDWDVRALLNQMLDTQRYFLGSARGEDASPPSPTPPATLSDDPVADLEAVRRDMLAAYGERETIEKAEPALGVAFSDLLVHSWDVARATGQDETMPDGLAATAYELVHGKFTDEQRKGTFKPEVSIGDDASSQDRLLAYTGRDPRLSSTPLTPERLRNLPGRWHSHSNCRGRPWVNTAVSSQRRGCGEGEAPIRGRADRLTQICRSAFASPRHRAESTDA